MLCLPRVRAARSPQGCVKQQLFECTSERLPFPGSDQGCPGLRHLNRSAISSCLSQRFCSLPGPNRTLQGTTRALQSEQEPTLLPVGNWGGGAAKRLAKSPGNRNSCRNGHDGRNKKKVCTNPQPFSPLPSYLQVLFLDQAL